MIKTTFLLCFAFTLQIAFAQNNLTGKIYGDKVVAKYIKVTNTLKKKTTFSDENGNFSIKASLGDSIHFYSSFYEKKTIIIDNKQLLETIVIQLKNKVNTLEEVVLNEISIQKAFNAKMYDKEIKKLIRSDKKKKPWEYEVPPVEVQGINLKGFKYLKALLFPKKEKNENYIIIEPITFIDLNKLNSTDPFFNDVFFIKDLKIPKNLKSLFFDYFDAQEISLKFLNPNKRLALIEKFFKLSETFLNIVNVIKTQEEKL